MSARRRNHPLDRAAKNASATQFVAWSTHTFLIIAHNDGKWGQKADNAVDCSKSEQSVVSERSCGGYLGVAHQCSNGYIRNQFDQLGKRVTAEIDRSACAGGRYPRRGDIEFRAAWRRGYHIVNTDVERFHWSTLPPARPFSGHRSPMVRWWRDETESHVDNVYCAHSTRVRRR
jgi:hypothetical protein